MLEIHIQINTSMSSIPISTLLKMNTENSVVVLDQNKTAADAVNLMKENSARCVLVSDTRNEVIGLVSKTDILYRVVSIHKNPAKVILKDIMSSPIISVPLETS